MDIPASDLRNILEVHGEDCKWTVYTEYKDEWGNLRETSGSSKTIRAHFENIRADELLHRSAEFENVSMRAYVKPSLGVKVGDSIIRNPGESDEIEYTIRTDKDYVNYKELELEAPNA